MFYGSEWNIGEEKRIQQMITPGAAAFLKRLHNHFGEKRRELVSLGKHFKNKEKTVFKGMGPNITPVPRNIRERGVEVTARADKNMLLHAFHAEADLFVADFEYEDKRENVLQWQMNLYDAIRKQNGFQLNGDQMTELVVKPRGWELEETELMLDGKLMAASLVDFGIYFYHNAKELSKQSSRPHFYLSNLKNHLEARLWNDVFIYAQNDQRIPQGTIKATIINETVIDSFELNNILYELADHCTEIYYTI